MDLQRLRDKRNVDRLEVLEKMLFKNENIG